MQVINMLNKVDTFPPVYNQNSNHLFDAYRISNVANGKIMLPKNCTGAIGVTLDEKTKGVAHTGLDILNQFSLYLQGIESVDRSTGKEYQKFMHAFIVTNQFDPKGVSVCEAVQNGIRKAEIRIGDTDWTSMIIFIPKDLNVSNKTAEFANAELRPDEMGKVSSYAFGAGFKSLFSRKQQRVTETNTEIIADELANLIRGRSIKDDSGNPKDAVCSQLALRIFRSGLLAAQFSSDEMQKLRQKDKAELKGFLLNELIKADSPVAKLYASCSLFEHEASEEALPFELYRMLMKESSFHDFSCQSVLEGGSSSNCQGG